MLPDTGNPRVDTRESAFHTYPNFRYLIDSPLGVLRPRGAVTFQFPYSEALVTEEEDYGCGISRGAAVIVHAFQFLYSALY